jgi:very-short-patch-repair endonuclease/DNA-binding CsgD family transcriptional regulator
MNRFSQKHKEFLINQYINEEKSTYEIAQELNTYPNKVRRALKSLGIALRDKSSAQSVAIASGRHEHPTKGKKRTESEKIAISDGMYSYWKEMDDEERDRRSELSKRQWANMSDEERETLRQMAAEAVRRASKEGSKIEKFLYESLTKEGYRAIFHKKGLIASDKLEVDIFIPELKTAIEIDGPAHFLPIWGEANLNRHIRADAVKAGLLINRGYVIIRVKNLIKNLSAKNMRDAFDILLVELKKVEENFPPLAKRLIEIET